VRHLRAEADDVRLIADDWRDADCDAGRAERIGAIHCLAVSHLKLLRHLQRTQSG